RRFSLVWNRGTHERRVVTFSGDPKLDEALSRNYSRCRRMIDGRNDGKAQLGGFFVEHRYLLLAVLVFVELLTPVDVFLSEAQHAVEQDCQFVGHGRDRFGRPQFAAEAAILRSPVAVATPERESRDAEGAATKRTIARLRSHTVNRACKRHRIVGL